MATEKSATATYKIVAFLFALALLIYVHDAIPKGFGKIGLSSARVYLYTVLAELRFLLALFFIYYLAKGKQWRFVVWLPIIMCTYQTVIRVLALQNTGYNEFDVKLVVTVFIAALITVYYFIRKRHA